MPAEPETAQEIDPFVARGGRLVELDHADGVVCRHGEAVPSRHGDRRSVRGLGLVHGRDAIGDQVAGRHSGSRRPLVEEGPGHARHGDGGLRRSVDRVFQHHIGKRGVVDDPSLEEGRPVRDGHAVDQVVVDLGRRGVRPHEEAVEPVRRNGGMGPRAPRHVLCMDVERDRGAGRLGGDVALVLVGITGGQHVHAGEGRAARVRPVDLRVAVEGRAVVRVDQGPDGCGIRGVLRLARRECVDPDAVAAVEVSRPAVDRVAPVGAAVRDLDHVVARAGVLKDGHGLVVVRGVVLGHEDLVFGLERVDVGRHAVALFPERHPVDPVRPVVRAGEGFVILERRLGPAAMVLVIGKIAPDKNVGSHELAERVDMLDVDLEVPGDVTIDAEVLRHRGVDLSLAHAGVLRVDESG